MICYYIRNFWTGESTTASPDDLHSPPPSHCMYSASVTMKHKHYYLIDSTRTHFVIITNVPLMYRSWSFWRQTLKPSKPNQSLPAGDHCKELKAVDTLSTSLLFHHRLYLYCFRSTKGQPANPRHQQGQGRPGNKNKNTAQAKYAPYASYALTPA